MPMPTSLFHRIPVVRKLVAIAGIFPLVVLCVFFLGVVRSDILTGIRACVAGEGLWSKAEQHAALSLTRYAEDRSSAEYQEYLSEIAVPLGDRQARLQLLSPSPDMGLVYEGFLEGRNSPEDAKRMTRLFRRFRDAPDMQKAMGIWTEGDRQIGELRTAAEALHAEINGPAPEERRIHRLVEQIDDVDARLSPLEDEFSSTLGHGARWIDRVLSLLTVAAMSLLLLIGLAFSIAVISRIRNSEEKYYNLINTANDAILVMDRATGHILEANYRACELLGYSEAQLLGMPESRLYPSAAGGGPAKLLTASTRGSSREVELLCANGTILPVEVSASETEFARKPAILGIFRDLRERREAAAVLRRSEDRFGYLIQNLSDVITIVAVDGTMLYHSPSIERVAGYRPAELLGKSFLAYLHPDDEPSVRAALERVTLRVGSATPPEFRFRHKNGSWVWLESVGNNLLNDVAVGGIVVTSRDVSARRVLEDQVRQSQKMEAVGRLAGGIAHDFNNLLMVIQGYAEIVLHEESLSAAARKSVETIVRTSESAANLTRQLLSFSRKHAFSPQVLDLNSLVNRMSEMLLGVLREEMDFVVKLCPDACCLSADPAQIEQVVMNLVVNARDAMPKGGTLTLETAHVTAETVRASRQSGVEPGDYVMLAVSDTGIGMDPEIQSRIFEPFFTTKGKEEGTGLGLSVVYNIVRGGGGQVRVLSEPGKGSTLQVFFPRVSERPAAPVLEVRPEPARAGMETILVAEDQPDLRWMICQFLQALGYSVLEATDGRDAIALAEQYEGAIDVVLTDVVMPHARGPEVARRLTASRPTIKVIYMSGYTEGEITAVGEANPPKTTILQKPFELDLLAAKIRDVLGARTRQ